MIASASKQQVGLDYYDGPEVDDVIFDALRDAGLDAGELAIDELAQLDEFHALGRGATVALAELCAIAPQEAVLDVGAGIGGPARVLAQRYGARVTALDGSARFCRAGERLCKAAGLADRVDVVHGDALALPFADASFDVVWTQALAQNIEDKAMMLGELRRVLRPGGRYAMFELVSGPGGQVCFPVPWGDGPHHSFLVSGPQLRSITEAAGFAPLVWNQAEDALASVAGAIAEIGELGGAGELGLQLLIPDFEARMAGLARNVAEKRVELVQAVLTA